VCHLQVKQLQNFYRHQKRDKQRSGMTNPLTDNKKAKTNSMQMELHVLQNKNGGWCDCWRETVYRGLGGGGGGGGWGACVVQSQECSTKKRLYGSHCDLTPHRAVKCCTPLVTCDICFLPNGAGKRNSWLEKKSGAQKHSEAKKQKHWVIVSFFLQHVALPLDMLHSKMRHRLARLKNEDLPWCSYSACASLYRICRSSVQNPAKKKYACS
jgi:hypothetical protein